MDIEEIKNFIIESDNKLFNVNDQIIDNYILDNFEIPMFINNNYDYDFLKQIHFQISAYIFHIEEVVLLDDTNESDRVVDDLLRLKIFVDNIIKNHNSYTEAKFKKEYNSYLLELKKEDNYISIHDDIKHNKSNFIKSLYNLLIKEKRISSSQNQRKAFISLFFPTKLMEPVKWNYPIYDLKRFFDVLIKKNIIAQPDYFNEYVTHNFLILNKQKIFQPFKVKSFQTSKDKQGYNDLYYIWDQNLIKIKKKFR